MSDRPRAGFHPGKTMIWKCPFREKRFFCTHKANGRQFKPTGGIQRPRCSYSEPSQCPYFQKYYESLTPQEKAIVDLIKPVKLNLK